MGSGSSKKAGKKEDAQAAVAIELGGGTYRQTACTRAERSVHAKLRAEECWGVGGWGGAPG